MENRFVTL